MSIFFGAVRRKSDGLPPWAALDQESLRISAAMEHVQDHGNLDSFPGGRNERLALMLSASRQGLVTWDRAGERYELTSLGRERLGMRRALQESGGPMNLRPASAGSPMNLPPASAVPAGRFLALGSGTIMAGIAGLAIGAAAMTLLPGSSKLPPRDRAAVATAARNPGIPCLAEKCLETGGSAERPAQQAGQPEHASNAPVPAPAPAAVHTGQTGAVEGAPAPQPSRRSAERARTYQAPAIDPEPPGYAQSTDEPSPRAAGAADKSRNRDAATGQRQSWSDGKRKPSTSRREYVEEEAGGPGQGAIVRRYPERDDGPPSIATRRYRGEQARRRGGDAEDRPGYAYREPQGLGYREARPRFGPFDWLFR
jgi:hypothetical protein